MKLLVYAHRLEVGGTQVNAIELAAALRDEHGFEVLFFAQPGPMVAAVEARGLRFVPAPDARFHPSMARMRALRQLVELERPNLLYAWDWWQCLDAFYAVYLPMRVPLVVTDMMMEHQRVLPRHVPTTFGVPALADAARRMGYRRVLTLVPPVDVAFNAPSAADGDGFRACWNVRHDEILLVTVSRLADWLKSESLVRSIRVVRHLARGRPVRFLIVGDGSIRDRLQHLANEANAAAQRECVTLVGAMLDPRPAYAAADVVIGMGGSALRGMAFGKPTVVVGKAGYSAVLGPDNEDTFYRDGLYGEGKPGTDDQRHLDDVQYLVDDGTRRRELGLLAREFVVRHYSLAESAARLATFCRQTAETPPSMTARVSDVFRTTGVYLRERRFWRASRDASVQEHREQTRAPAEQLPDGGPMVTGCVSR